MSSDSEFGSYKVSTFDSLAPRPTLRYEPGTRWAPSRTTVPARSGSQKKALAEREPIPEETLKAHKRIDTLADDLDASDLRELMERDQRRRERKRQREQEKIERRLERRAARHRREEEEARKAGTPPPENHERGVMGRELVGLGIDPASAIVTSSKHRSSESMKPASDEAGESPKHPLESFHRTDTMPMAEPEEADKEIVQPPSPPPENDEEPVSALPQVSLLANLLRSKKSRSKSTLDSDRDRTVSPASAMADDDLMSRKASETSTRAGRFSLSLFLKWGGKGRRNSGPSSFSNTSREEMQAAAMAQAQALQAQAQSQGHGRSQTGLDSHSTLHANAHALAKLQGDEARSSSEGLTGNYLSRKPSSGVPKRTRSRFREDLPEFPLSPPDSRVQSPEAEPPLPPLPESHATMTRTLPKQIIDRNDTPTSTHGSLDGMRQISGSTDRTLDASSPDPPLSMSLASIDSEGSWLSGRVGSRRMRDVMNRTSRPEPSETRGSPASSTHEDLAIADDEYMSRLAPEHQPVSNVAGRRSGDGRPSSDEDEFPGDDEMRWGAVGARRSVVKSHRYNRETVQSREVLLEIESSDEPESGSPTSPTNEEPTNVQRARSVNLSKGHARNFSAGSAKLLDITPRLSLDGRQASRERRRSAPLI